MADPCTFRVVRAVPRNEQLVAITPQVETQEGIEDMSDANIWRTALAEEITARYAEHPAVEAVALIGSAARGWADAYSDVELGVFWRDEPREIDLQTLVERIGGTDRHSAGYDAPIQAWGEDYLLRGVKIDLGHWLTAAMNGIVTDVVEASDTALPKQTSVSALLNAVPLYGQTTIQPWQQRARVYPDALADKTIRQNISFSPMWMLRMLAERGDFPLVRRNLSTLAHKLFTLLCAVNRVYYPGHKWTPRILAGMAASPPDFVSRLDAALIAPLPCAVEEFEHLIHEVFDLVNTYVPSVDLAVERARLAESPHYFPQAPDVNASH